MGAPILSRNGRAGESRGYRRGGRAGPAEAPPPPPPPVGPFATSTLIWRPSSEVPFSRDTASLASSAVAISTNPNPRERPVSRSVTTLADSTDPTPAHAPRSPALDVENDSPPTNSFTAIEVPLPRLPHCARPELGRSSGRGPAARRVPDEPTRAGR